MANICDFEIRVKGSRKAGLLVYASMPCYGDKVKQIDKKSGKSHLIGFSGNCKWSVNYGVTDSMDKVDLSSLEEDRIMEEGDKYLKYSLRAKSKAFDCEIMVHYWSEESDYDQFDHYVKGDCVKSRKIAFDYDNNGTEFNWRTLEFVGHEGEYNDSVDGEESDASFMSALFGVPQKKDNNVSSSNTKNSGNPQDVVNDLEAFLKQSNHLFDEIEMDINSEEINDTSLDMYDWKFTEGNTVRGKGFTIAIPDGFAKCDSGSANSTKERDFVLVPTNHLNSNPDKIPVTIMCGGEQKAAYMENKWMVHPYANAGIASVVGTSMAVRMVENIGIATPVFSTSWSDVAAYTMLQRTGSGSYSYQINVLIDNRAQMLRIQTQNMNDEQKACLNKSFVEWLHTLKFDKANKMYPLEPLVDNKTCIEGVLKNDLKKFNEAVDQAKNEYVATINGRIKAWSFALAFEVIGEFPRECYEMTLNEGMEVREYYLKKFDALFKNPELKDINPLTKEKMLKKLHDLDEDLLDIDTEYGNIAINVSKTVADIRTDWKEQEESLAEQTKELEEIEQKRLAEEKARKAEERKRKAAEKRKREAEKKKKEEEEKRRLEEIEAQKKELEEEKKKIRERRSEIKEEIKLLETTKDSLQDKLEAFDDSMPMSKGKVVAIIMGITIGCLAIGILLAGIDNPALPIIAISFLLIGVLLCGIFLYYAPSKAEAEQEREKNINKAKLTRNGITNVEEKIRLLNEELDDLEKAMPWNKPDLE